MFTDEEKTVLWRALWIALEDGGLFNDDDDDKETNQIVESIRQKLRVKRHRVKEPQLEKTDG